MNPLSKDTLPNKELNKKTEEPSRRSKRQTEKKTGRIGKAQGAKVSTLKLPTTLKRKCDKVDPSANSAGGASGSGVVTLAVPSSVGVTPDDDAKNRSEEIYRYGIDLTEMKERDAVNVSNFVS